MSRVPDDLYDPVNRPTHYTYSERECIDVIEQFDLPYHLGNALKYIIRCRHKGDLNTDLEKAIWYISRYIELRRKDDAAA